MTRSAVLCAALFAITMSAAPPAAHADASVPAIGCPTDGQLGPEPAPRNATKRVKLDGGAASGLAFYRNAEIGVLGPRGWHCLVLAGSNGMALYVTRDELKAQTMLASTFEGFSGEAIQLSVASGETSGRFEAAKFIARLFPQDRIFVEHVIAEKIEPASHFVFGPYPTDRLKRRSEALVEYETPAGTKGLGTDSRLLPNGAPISGMVFLGEDESVTSLALRLADKSLAAAIIRQTETNRGLP
jgi:hypothetical protein